MRGYICSSFLLRYELQNVRHSSRTKDLLYICTDVAMRRAVKHFPHAVQKERRGYIALIDPLTFAEIFLPRTRGIPWQTGCDRS